MTQLGEKLGMHEALDTIAHLSATGGHAETAVRLAGAAARLRSAGGTHSWPLRERSRERWLASAGEVPDEEMFYESLGRGTGDEP
jgi:hypothetical protein